MADIKLSLNLYQEANEKGMTFSQFLESIDPSTKYNDGLDAFERQVLRVSEKLTNEGKNPIYLKSIPEKGIWASPVSAFYQTEESAVLFPEFINRTAREALKESSTLKELVAITTPIDGDAYRTIYFEDAPEATQLKRVAQGAELPLAIMKTSENAIRLYKYGRQLKMTYEAARRMRIDLFAHHIQSIMLQVDVDRAAAAIDVLINGDGNNNAATNHNKTDLQGGETTDALAYKGWAKFMALFYPHVMTTVVCNLDTLIDHLLSIEPPNVDPLKLIEQLRTGRTTAGGTMAQPLFNDYRIVYNPEVPDDVLLGLDRRYALEMVTEIGADITETAKIIGSQWEQATISETVGFGIFLPKARATLTADE